MTYKKVDKWPKFKEIGTKQNQIGKSGGERKKIPSANPGERESNIQANVRLLIDMVGTEV